VALDCGGVDETVALGPLGGSSMILVVPDVLNVEIMNMTRYIPADSKNKVEPEVFAYTESCSNGKWGKESTHDEQKECVTMVASWGQIYLGGDVGRH